MAQNRLIHLGVALLPLVALGSALSCRPSGKVRLNINDAGRQIELRKGRTFDISLEANPTTGFRWEVAELDEQIVVQSAEPEFTPQAERIGAGGTQVFHFRAVGVGQTRLTLVYRRPWEKGVAPQQSYSLDILVR